MVFLQRCLSSGISTMKEFITLKKERLFTILFLMSLGAFVGAFCGSSMLMWMLWTSDVPQEVQQMREAISAVTQASGWALKNTGTAINLQRSSSSSAWLCSVFWFLCAPPILDTFVQPDSSPGYCWPFQGSQSEVLIRLPAKIRPAAITVQHTLKIDAPLRTVSSAPRDFTVSGLDEGGKDETLLGTFTYAAQEEPVQTFPLQDEMRDFRFLKLVVQSNWGKPGYTCIYRVQVHGKMDGTSAIRQIPGVRNLLQ
ncbi:SUN domain-containing protein 2-like [Strigops habroptila]|uniref:SUN domain-containing protein 2-like n=1 Tax=Strigops habroptila TaxID=2489341 RepID=UPI0011CF2AD0|nr:SUN domain-containing protein 2-like [Strigops habroptila]